MVSIHSTPPPRLLTAAACSGLGPPLAELIPEGLGTQCPFLYLLHSILLALHLQIHGTPRPRQLPSRSLTRAVKVALEIAPAT